MAKVTIEDISQQTGLSRGTVSRALNDRSDISEQTKQRVLEVCRKLNYFPSHAARSLATGRNFAVAVVVRDLQSTFTATFLRGVQARAEREHYVICAVELGDDGEAVARHLEAIDVERFDTILFGTALDARPAERLREAFGQRPAASTAPQPGWQCDVLEPDETESGRLVGRHLLQAVGRDILYVHRAGAPGAEARLAGFREVCQERGADPQVTIVAHDAAARPADWLAAVQAQLERVRAVATTDDFLAIQVLLACLRVGRVSGENIAVMGQGNERIGAEITPTLSTTDFDGEEIGRRAMDVVAQRLAKTRLDTPQTIQVPPRLIVRDSTRVV